MLNTNLCIYYTWLSVVVLLDGLCSWSDRTSSSHRLLSSLLNSSWCVSTGRVFTSCSSSDLFRNSSSVQSSGSGSVSGVSDRPWPSWPFIHCSRCMAPPLLLLVLLSCLHLCSISSSICFCISNDRELFTRRCA